MRLRHPNMIAPCGLRPADGQPAFNIESASQHELSGSPSQYKPSVAWPKAPVDANPMGRAPPVAPSFTLAGEVFSGSRICSALTRRPRKKNGAAAVAEIPGSVKLWLKLDDE